jgi:hypothetical protein
MPTTLTFQATRASKPIGGDILLSLVFASPIIALVLAFAILTNSEQGSVAQTVEQVASYQM